MITGAILIGQDERVSPELTRSTDPATGDAIEPGYSTASAEDVAAACALADTAAIPFAALPAEKRAAFLEAIGEEIMAIGDDLIVRAMLESALPRGRLEGERGRTVGQLGLFAKVLCEGSWADITIDPALPDRQPLPRPDLRRRNIALGPVAVFGASNFPLAFSVAGGDTASALAAGCPVVVKGHPSHPGTGELVARAIARAAARCDMPEGVFSYLPGGVETGTALVTDPRIKAVGFTGSRGGGLALVQAAANRREPIPVYAEMSSINPVLPLPSALASRGADLGSAFIASLNMGAGQFCTNPGLVIAVDGPGLAQFLDAAKAAVGSSPAQTMLNPGIHAAYDKGIAAFADHAEVEVLAQGEAATGCNEAVTTLLRTSAEAFLTHDDLGEELFGSASLVVVASDADEVTRVLSRIEGQLTATLLMDEADEPQAAALLPILERKVGRILVNGWPTGVEVCHAMVHGGPFPSTSDSRTTSVGSAAIARFLRPVCYQNFSATLLPDELGDANPLAAPRRIDGTLELPR